ncbi:hypothetical protein LEP1GSC088_1632 [Leptospira interrogans str. L1207]|nr:hypothetical protein LEP1GSC087_3392 [Leptospira interrogans serovar Bataviae str. L1111]EMN48688.1 hypothetical protein LEP1GSC088_1632 [Leptospira interrogans str. L1207]EMN93218.1 hypothetical protein LEP1GSC110_2885 [Leptospira interrogans serovar Medanensis str. UT053]
MFHLIFLLQIIGGIRPNFITSNQVKILKHFTELQIQY